MSPGFGSLYQPGFCLVYTVSTRGSLVLDGGEGAAMSVVYSFSSGIMSSLTVTPCLGS